MIMLYLSFFYNPMDEVLKLMKITKTIAPANVIMTTTDPIKTATNATSLMPDGTGGTGGTGGTMISSSTVDVVVVV